MAEKRNQTKASEVDAKTISIWISALSDQTDRMTPWEVDFITNVSDQFENGQLSDKQITTLKNVYDKYY